MPESLTLKWGTLKAWRFKSDRCKKLFDRYIEIGASLSAIMQHNTPEQQQIICDLIDAVNCKKIYLEWDDKYVSKDDAKKYVLDYGKKRAQAASAAAAEDAGS